jgi:hypothetical protein
MMSHVDSRMSNSTASSSMYSKSTGRSVGSDSTMSLGLGLDEFPRIDEQPTSDAPGVATLTGEGWLAGHQLASMFKYSPSRVDGAGKYVVPDGSIIDEAVHASPRIKSGSPGSAGAAMQPSPRLRSPSSPNTVLQPSPLTRNPGSPNTTMMQPSPLTRNAGGSPSTAIQPSPHNRSPGSPNSGSSASPPSSSDSPGSSPLQSARKASNKYSIIPNLVSIDEGDVLDAN